MWGRYALGRIVSTTFPDTIISFLAPVFFLGKDELLSLFLGVFWLIIIHERWWSPTIRFNQDLMLSQGSRLFKRFFFRSILFFWIVWKDPRSGKLLANFILGVNRAWCETSLPSSEKCWFRMPITAWIFTIFHWGPLENHPGIVIVLGVGVFLEFLSHKKRSPQD